MEEELIDFESHLKPKLKPKLNLAIWVSPVIILIGLYFCMTAGILGNLSVILTIVLLLLALLFNSIKPLLGVTISTITLILGIVGLCQIYPTQNLLVLKLGSFQMTFEVRLIIVFMFHLILTAKSHEKIFRWLNQKALVKEKE